MRILLILSTFLIFLNGIDLKSCKACHPIIYSEFEDSMHNKSSIQDDKIHKAVWKKHPLSAKGEYKCAKCHSPNIKMENTQHGVNGITCITCHSIKSIKEHVESNENVYETKDKLLYSAQKGKENQKVIYKIESSWFGLVKRVKGSPYHDIDYRNKIFYTGEVCMGCHSHKKNSKGLDVCRTDSKGAKSKKSNCITCHMPKIKGSATTIRISDKHAFHGFAGLFNSPKLLSKYINLDYKISDRGFKISIENKAPHNLLLHPLRVLKLKTTIYRNGKKIQLKEYNFKRVIGTSKNKKASMPWLADAIIKDSTIKADETRVISFNTKLQKGDEVEVSLGFNILNPKVAKRFNLEKDKTLTEFKPIKHLYFQVK